MIKKYTLFTYSTFLLLSLLLYPLLVFSAAVPDASSPVIPNPTNSGSLEQVLGVFVKFIYRVGIPILVVFVVLAGLSFVLAQGNEKKLQEARQRFYWVLIGSAIITGAGVIANIIINFAKGL